MKLRWTDEHSYAETFEANDTTSFIENGTAALRVFRAATGRRVHRGEIHQNEFWGVAPNLHLEIGGLWYGPGHIEHTDSGLAFLNSFQVRFERDHASTLDALHATDAAQMVRSSETWWRGVYDAWRWSNAINAMIMAVCDGLGRETC